VFEANLVGSRGCPYDCSFCRAAISANPDVTIRTRTPENLIDEMEALAATMQVRAFRFVDDLFLASPPFMRNCLGAFKSAGISTRFAWDATGRINILSKAPDALLDLMKEAGCREVALGIESGSTRLLTYMGKRITPEMTKKAVLALTSRGIHVKGYFILGFPTETQADLYATVDVIRDLWTMTETQPGTFRCSAFEFRPYPGTPEWNRLLATGHYQEEELLAYTAVDLTDQGHLQAMLERDEFNFSVNRQFGEVPLPLVREALTHIMVEQKQRLATGPDHVQRTHLGLRT
jgi:anaerobic magnesium-protoporphyrin IX monomethyl ester cyclase